MAINVSNLNAASLQAQRSLQGSGLADLSRSLRVSSRPIGNDANDQDRVSVVNRIRDQLSQTASAGRTNANDGISMVQTADGGLSEVSDNLQRMRSLATQAADQTKTAADRQALQQELTKSNDEIDRIASTSQFNGQKLLDGSLSGVANTQASALGRIEGNDADQGLRSIDLSTEAGAKDALARIDSAISSVTESRSALGASANRTGAAMGDRLVSNMPEGLAQKRLNDANEARALSDQLSNQLRQNYGAAMLAQANTLPQLAGALMRG